jgi:hypothetical protein
LSRACLGKRSFLTFKTAPKKAFFAPSGESTRSP